MDFSVDELVKLCGIDRKTAHRWRNGQQPIGKIALKLLTLHAQGRIVPNTPDWRLWRFQGEVFTWDRSGWRFDGKQAREMFFTVRDARRFEAENRQLRDYITYLEKLTPRAEVIPLEHTRPSVTEEHYGNPLFGEKIGNTAPKRRAT